jgi:hypothetical protein
MRALFTIHAGEYLAGSHIEHNFKRVNVWLPTRDTGIDLLVSDRRNIHNISLQVKFSKDFLVTHFGPMFQKQLRACGWWTINHQKLRASPADYWVFALQGFASGSTDFVVMPRLELCRRLRALHGRANVIQSYLWVTEDDRCWETRGLNKADQVRIANGEYRHRTRDFSRWLNNWGPVKQLNKPKPAAT